jgi:hypothetical protein
MQRIVTWLKRIGIGIYALVAGAVVGGGCRVIVDRRDMYGDDPDERPALNGVRPFLEPQALSIERAGSPGRLPAVVASAEGAGYPFCQMPITGA